MMILLLITQILSAASSSEVENFIRTNYGGQGVNIKSIKILETKPLKELKGWDAIKVKISVDLRGKPMDTQMILFSKDRFISTEIYNITTNTSLKEALKPKLDAKFYKSKHLVAGNADAKNKIVAFSDPLCPYCGRYIPRVMKLGKDAPKDVAVYLYHRPLPSIHPAAVFISKAMIHLQYQKGKNLYDLKNALLKDMSKFNASTTDADRVLNVLNKILKTNVKAKDLETEQVKRIYAEDIAAADELMVNATPTIYINGKKDAGLATFMNLEKQFGK